jgi:hypothetical protein
MKFLTTVVFMPPTWNNGMLEFWNNGQNIKGSGVLPNPELFKTSVDVFSNHDGFIS